MPRDPDYAGPAVADSPSFPGGGGLPQLPHSGPTVAEQAEPTSPLQTFTAGERFPLDPYRGFQDFSQGYFQQQFPKHLYEQYLIEQQRNQVLTDQMLQELLDRTSTMPLDFIKEAPATAIGVSTSPLNTYAVKLIGQGLERAYPWLKASTGVDGILVGAYANALQIDDPAMRGAALTMVQALAENLGVGFDPSQPAGGPGAALRELQVLQQEFGATQAQLGGMRSEPIEVQGPHGTSLVFNQDGTLRQVDIETTDSPFDEAGNLRTNLSPEAKRYLEVYALIHYLFGDVPIRGAPQGIGKLSQAAGVVSAGIGTGFDGVFKAGGEVLGQTLGEIPGLGEPVRKAVGGALRYDIPLVGQVGEIPSRAGDIVMSPFSLAFAGTADILAGVNAITPGGQSRVQSRFINPLQTIWPSQPGSGLGLAFNATFGVKPSDPAFQRNMEVGSFISTWAGFKLIGNLGRAAKASGLIGRSVLPGGRAGEPAPFDVTLRDIMRQTKNLSPEQAAFRDYAAERFGAIGGRLYEWASKTPLDFTKTAMGRNFVNDILRIKRERGKVGGRIFAQYEGSEIPVDLARALDAAGPTFAEVADAYVRYMTDQPQVSIQAKMSERQQIIEDLAIKVEPLDTAVLTETLGSARNFGGEANADLLRVLESLPKGTPGLQASVNDLTSMGQGKAYNVFERGPDGKPRGFLQASFKQDGTFEDFSIAVDPAYQRQGIGKAMIQKAVEEFGRELTPEALQAVIAEIAKEGLSEQGRALGLGVISDLGRLDPLTKANLQLRLAELDRDLAAENRNYPAFEYAQPKAFKRIRANLPKNRAEAMLAWLYDPPVRFAPHISRLFDEMSHARIWNWFRDDAPLDAKNRNAELIQTYFQRAGVPVDEVTRVVRRMAEIKDDAGFYAWLTDDVAPLWDHARFVYEIERPKLKRLNDRSDEARHRSQVQTRGEIDGNQVFSSTDVLSGEIIDEFGQTSLMGLPSMSAELIDHVWLPSVDRLIDSSSASRHYVKSLYAKGGLSKDLAVALQGLRGLSGLATSVLKPLILTVRVPALVFRQQLEQTARNSGYGYHILNPFTLEIEGGFPRVRSRFAPELEAAGIRGPELGLLFDPLTEVLESPGSKHFRLGDTYDVLPGGQREMTEFGANAVHWNITKVFKSPEIRQLMKGGLDDWVEWVDSPAGTVTRARFDPILERSTLARDHPEWGAPELRREWGRRMLTYLDELFGGRADLRLAALTGKWRIREGAASQSYLEAKLGADGYAGYTAALEELALIGGKYRDLRLSGADAETLRAARTERLAARNRVKKFEDQAKVSRALDVDLGNREAFMRALTEATRAGEYLPPKKLGGFDRLEMSNPETAAHFRNWIQRFLYTNGPVGFIPGLRRLFQIETAAKADLLFSRGSLWKQISDQEYAALKLRGYKSGEARLLADTEAARRTADIMYDLSSRTSAQRFLRNQSYFLPAYQEILTTWLVKIPSESYWPVGAAVLAGKANLLIGALKDAGVMKKDSNGDWIVPIPGLGKLLSKLGVGPVHFLGTLDPKVVDDMISFRANSLNLVSQGWPSVSTQYALPLNVLAKYTDSGLIDSIQHTLSAFSSETTFTPGAITYAWEASTGSPPPWEFFSIDFQRQVADLGYDDAIKQAIAELGAKAPIRENFPSDVEYWAAQREYRDMVMGRAEETFRAWAFVRMLGASIGPAALRVTDSYREDARKTMDTIYGNAPDRDDPAYAAWYQLKNETVDRFLADHPGSVAYLVGKTILTEQARNLPYTRDSDDSAFEQILRGERRTLTPDEFLTRVGGWESYRHYIGLKREAMGGYDLTASELLAQGKVNLDAKTEFEKAWSRYLSLNPDVNAMVTTQKQLWDSRLSPDDIPVSAFETEWLSKGVTFINDLANATAVGGIRDTDIRHTLSDAKYLFSQALAGAEPFTQVQKDTAWYALNVLTPYWEKVIPLYEKAQALAASGGNPGPIYDQIREIANAANKTYTAPSGEVFGYGPEEVQWGKLTPQEQEQTRLGWASRPIAWLSDYQRTQAGWNLDNTALNTFFAEVNRRQVAFDELVRLKGWSQGSSDYETAKKRMEQDLARVALGSGPDVAEAWRLNQSPPAARISALGLGNAVFDSNVATAAAIGNAIRNSKGPYGPYSITGFSKTSPAYDKKASFFAALDRLTVSDPAFGDFIDTMGQAMHAKGLDFLEGPLLFNALFFGGFDPRLIPPEFVEAHQRFLAGGNPDVERVKSSSTPSPFGGGGKPSLPPIPGG